MEKENIEFMCSKCGRTIRQEESLWVREIETVCEDCHAKGL